MARDDARAWQIAREQLWLITLAQLRECGFTMSSVKHRLRTGRLWRVFPAVYAVGRPELGRERLALAAVLACGEGAALSLIWAAVHLVMWEKAPPACPQVTVRSDYGRTGRGGLELHRSSSLTADDVIIHRGIPTTSVFRTLTDNAAHLNSADLRSMLRQAQRVHKIALPDLRDYLDARPRTPHRYARLRRILDEYLPQSALTQTEREALFFELCAQHGLPLPEPQYPIAGLTADFAWPDRRVVVELDDRASHESAVQHGEDLIRDRVFRAAGFHVERFTVAEAIRDPALVARQLRPHLVR